MLWCNWVSQLLIQHFESNSMKYLPREYLPFQKQLQLADYRLMSDRGSQPWHIDTRYACADNDYTDTHASLLTVLNKEMFKCLCVISQIHDLLQIHRKIVVLSPWAPISMTSQEKSIIKRQNWWPPLKQVSSSWRVFWRLSAYSVRSVD